MVTLTEKYKIGVLCGDLRSVYLALEFQKTGFEVYACGLYEDEAALINNICQNPSDIIGVCNVLILPLPSTRDNIYVYSKTPQIKVKLSDLSASRQNSKIFFGGILPTYFFDMCEQNGHKCLDYYKSEELIYKNATATAEGAIMTAMSSTNDTICESTYGIIGYGRIATQLAEMLKGLGGKVTVFARKDSDLSEARNKGCDVFKLESRENEVYFQRISEKLNECSVIFNTVPAIILNENIISKLSLNQIYIELASCPGGIDTECARVMKLKNIYAPSLPGRYAPRSAGKYIFDEIIKKLYMLDNSESEGV